jgi:hypothetical protein
MAPTRNGLGLGERLIPGRNPFRVGCIAGVDPKVAPRASRLRPAGCAGAPRGNLGLWDTIPLGLAGRPAKVAVPMRADAAEFLAWLAAQG